MRRLVLAAALAASFGLAHLTLSATDRQVAITFGDLPRGGDGGPRTLEGVRAMTERLLKPFRDQKIPVTGFVNEGRQADFGADGLRQILNLWLESEAATWATTRDRI